MVKRDKILVWFRLLLCYLLVTFVQLLGMGIVAPTLFGIDLSDPANLSKESKLLMLFVGILFATLVILLIRKFVDRRTVASLGLLDKEWSKNLLAGLGLGGFTQVVVFILLLLLGSFKINGFAWSVSTVMFSLFAACLVAWLEELEFRAYTVENLKIFGMWVPILVSALIFVIPHYGGRGLDNPAVYISIFLFGVLAALVYILRGSIYMPLGFHIGFNFSSDLLLSGQIVKVQNLTPDWQMEIFTWIALGSSALILINPLKRLGK